MKQTNLSWQECLPPHGLTHPDKLESLIAQFEAGGWDFTKPRLLGYPFEDSVQLVSGSHRWLAARYTDTLLPVDVYPYEYIREIWGTEAWVELVGRYQ